LRSAHFVTLSLALAACGGTAPVPNCTDQPSTAPTSVLVTQTECSFVQHTDNILHNGTAFAPRPVTTANGLVAAQVTNQCGPWLMGKDASGVAVVVHTATGEVRSHGTVHPGMPLSSLPASLALPLTY
jgi:hypothetical protein